MSSSSCPQKSGMYVQNLLAKVRLALEDKVVRVFSCVHSRWQDVNAEEWRRHLTQQGETILMDLKTTQIISELKNPQLIEEDDCILAIAYSG